MKLATLLTGLIFVLPLAVFSASIPAGSPLDLQAAQTSDGDASGYTGLQLRARGDIQVLKARLPILVPLAATIAEGVVNVVAFILDQINNDNLGRSDFTQAVVRENHNQWPDYNWVIVHPDHKTLFDGVKGENWDHFHREYDIQIGGTIGYEIYWFESGTFERYGDGGYLNWAYFGNVVSTSNEGATVVFA